MIDTAFHNEQLHRLPSIEKVDYLPLQDTYLQYRRIVVVLWLFVVLVLVCTSQYLGWLVVPYLFTTLICTWLALALIALWATEKSFKVAGYAMRQHDVIYREGFIWRSTTAVPYSRIQHTEVSQGPIGRMYDLYSLEVYTAGGVSSDLQINGLNQSTAESIRAFIVQQADITDE